MAKIPDKAAASYHYFADAMRRVEGALQGQMALSGLIPDGWAEIALRRGPPGRTRVTLRVDSDVLAFFKGMGAGHLGRMNDVLAAYMHARVAGVVHGADVPGGRALAAIEAEAAASAKRRDMLRRFADGQAREEAARAALPEAEKRRLRLAELKAAAEARKRGR